MGKISALIIDDEPMPAKHLQGMIEQHCFEIGSTKLLHAPLEALEHLKTHTYDLIFLDVEMPDLDGFELLEEAQLPHTTQVIFTTAYSQYALDAFKANAAHYILKVVTKDDLVNAVRKASRLLDAHQQEKESPTEEHPLTAISVYYKEEHHIIKTKDIIRLEADRSYTTVVTVTGKLLSSKRLGYFEKALGQQTFFRCHHSHLINVAEVSKLGKGKGAYLVLSNGDVVPVANSKKEELERRIGIAN